jgi:hypothetical protein
VSPPDISDTSDPTVEGPRGRLAAALRPLITMTVSAALDDGDLIRAAEAVEAVTDSLAGKALPGKHPRRPPDMTNPPQEFFPSSPITGLLNPIAPPVRIWAVEGVDGGFREVRGDAWFDYPYEGPPTCVHGGVIAETFDEVLGAANMVADNAAMTGTLTIRYNRPTPLRTPLRIEARCVDRQGRKVNTWGGIYVGEELTAEARGIFIVVGPKRMVAIAESNPDSADPDMLAAMRAEAAAVAAKMAGSYAREGGETDDDPGTAGPLQVG